MRESIRTRDLAAVSARTAHLRDILEQHSHREEIGIYARLGVVEPAYVETMCAEHRAFDQALTSPMPAGARIAQTLSLLETLARHISAEDLDTFPYVHQVFSEADWDAVSEATSDNRRRRITASSRSR